MTDIRSSDDDAQQDGARDPDAAGGPTLDELEGGGAAPSGRGEDEPDADDLDGEAPA